MAGKKASSTRTERRHIAVLKNHFTTIKAAADALDVSTAAIYQWPEVPPKRAEEFERITRGKLKYRDLRPAT